jgi:UDP-GlcNAc:undecaprenyl-phosphate/decaprenyl-phosphate GlcNAc-1-phosphate transferase
MTSLVAPFMAAATAALLLTPAARWLSWRLSALDHADGHRKLHPGPVPHLGGVALLAALLIGTLADTPGRRSVASLPLLIAAAIICVVGWLDDRRGLRVRWKLFGQLLATLPLVCSGQAIEQLECGGMVLDLGWWAVPISIVWYVAVANAMNFIDGADGLAPLVGLAIAAAIALMSEHLGHSDAALLAVVLAGGLAGFLLHNWHPATIYLGDAGSMTTGLWLAVAAARGSSTPQLGTRLVVLIALLAVPLADVALAIVRRSLNGRRFWLADREHIHHRLLDRGWSVPGMVSLLAGIAAATGAIAFAAAIHGRELLAWGALATLAIAVNRVGLAGDRELALVKQFITNRMLDTLAIVSAGKKHRLSSQQLDRLPLPAAWAIFLADVERHQIDELEMTVIEGGNDWQHHWRASQMPAETLASWSLDVSVRQPSGATCRLRATTRQAAASAPVELLLLSDTLRSYAEHWAKNAAGLGQSFHQLGPTNLTTDPASGDDLARAA